MTDKIITTNRFGEEMEISVGDWVSFKCDVEQSGKVTSIEKSPSSYRHPVRYTLTLSADGNIFEGGYIGGQTTTEMDAEDCWK